MLQDIFRGASDIARDALLAAQDRMDSHALARAIAHAVPVVIAALRPLRVAVFLEVSGQFAKLGDVADVSPDFDRALAAFVDGALANLPAAESQLVRHHLHCKSGQLAIVIAPLDGVELLLHAEGDTEARLLLKVDVDHGPTH